MSEFQEKKIKIRFQYFKKQRQVVTNCDMIMSFSSHFH